MQEQIFVHGYFGRNKGILTGFVIFSIMSGTSYMLWSFLFEQASGFAGGTADTSIQQLCLSAGLCLLYFLVSQQLMFYFQRRLLKQINTQLKQDVFHALMKKGVAKFTEKNSAVYLSVLNNDVTNLENNYFAKIPEILQNGFVFLTCAGVLCYYDVRIVCLVILTALLPVAVPFLIGEKLSQKTKALYEELENYNRKLKDWMGGFEVIHSFLVEDEVKKRFAKSVEDVEKRRYEGRRYQNPYGILTLLLTYLILSIQLVVSAYLVFIGSISERMLLSIFYLISSVNNPIREIAYLLLDVKAAIPNARKVETLFKERPEESKKTGESVKSVMPLELKEVRFGYTKAKEVLHGVNMCFEKGKKYAIVGSSGCGKSTLLKLLANYYKDYEREILIGEQELRMIERKSLSRKIAMIHQNVFLFEDTLRANITMFQEYPDEEIKAAVKKAGLEKIVEDNPLGTEQMVCENGNNFSGGEKQRIAIARAILTRAEVLLLDEATSSLDAELSMQIEQLILSQKETTILNVTHRFHESILRQYDCILTMHQGKIVEMGTFEELMKKKQFFYSLYTVNH